MQQPAEHLADEDGIVVDHLTLRRWMLTETSGVGGRPLSILANGSR
jgi:hypothetical protein